MPTTDLKGIGLILGTSGLDAKPLSSASCHGQSDEHLAFLPELQAEPQTLASSSVREYREPMLELRND